MVCIFCMIILPILIRLHGFTSSATWCECPFPFWLRFFLICYMLPSSFVYPPFYFVWSGYGVRGAGYLISFSKHIHTNIVHIVGSWLLSLIVHMHYSLCAIVFAPWAHFVGEFFGSNGAKVMGRKSIQFASITPP